MAIAALATLFILPGLVGHDPWKADDATHFGIAFAMLEDGRWWLPSIAGQALPATPPLYYWLAALCARAFGWVLPLHDAARLATGLCAALLLAGMAAAAARLHGRDAQPIAILLTVGCLGLLVHSHDTQPWMAFLAGAAWTLAGLADLPQRLFAGALVAGLAIGLSVLSVGTIAALALLPLPLLIPVLHPRWRQKGSLLGLLAVLGTAAVIGFAWPLVLSFQDTGLADAWLRGQAATATGWSLSLGNVIGYLKMLPWFAWPALPLALWQLWRQRRALGEAGVALPLAAFAIFLLAVGAAEPARSLTALPLILPLVLLAVPAAASLRRGAANAFDWFGMMTFTLAAGLVWLGWIAMLSGWPPRLARKFAILEPGFVFAFSPFATALAVVVTLGWLWLIITAPRVPVRGTVTWAAGITTAWCLVSTLWLPWVDYGKTYRGLAASLKRALPGASACIVGRDLGAAQRASLHYFAGIKTIPNEARRAESCNLLLTQASGRPVENAPPGWRKIWEGRRPGDRKEIFRLYKRG